MIAMRRKWEITKKQKSISNKSTLILEIHKSQRAVKYASFGRSAFEDINDEKIRQYRQVEFERKNKEKEKRAEMQQLRTKRRFGMRSYGDMKQLEAAGLGSPGSGGAGTNGSVNGTHFDPYSLTVADRIRALKSRYSPADFYRDEAAMSKKQLKHIQPVKEVHAPNPSITKDLSNILQKNIHISRPQDGGNQSTSKIKSNLKNMKKLDLQEVLNYAPGTAVYFGATVAVQSRHGGFLSFNNASDIRASAHKILPSARFTIWNCDDLQDHGVVRYGDAVWLQAGVHEVLGAQYGGKTASPETGGMRKIHPSLINCRKENFFKAQQYGRWIVLNRANPTGMLGERVLHHDHIMLEQEWCFIASHTPYDSFMATYNPLEKHSLSKKADFFHPPEECEWKLHLVTLPSDDNPDSRFRQYLLEQAKHQIKLSTQERRKKESVLCQSLRSSLPPELQPERVVERHIPHVLSSQAKQHHLLSKFDKQMLHAFRCEGNDVKFLKQIYGTDSIIYQKAKMAADAQADEVKKSISKDLLYLSETEPLPTDLIPKSTLLEAENAYWDAANMVLMDTKAWVHLSSSMEKFQDISSEKKDLAARKIQKFLREKMVHFFGWKRSFRRIDGDSLRKIRQQAMPGQYHSTPAPTSPVIVKLQNHTPMSIQALSRANTCTSLPTTTKQLSRPESAPDVHMSAKKTTSLRSLLDETTRPSTATGSGAGHTFLTEDPHDHSAFSHGIASSSTSGGSTRKDVLSLCRQRRSSSVSAMLTARKMLFSDHSAPVISNVFEDNENDEDENDKPQNTLVEEGNKETPGEDGGSEGAEEDQPQRLISRNITDKKQKKNERKKKRMEQLMIGLGKTKERGHGLPRDVFQDPSDHINVSTTLHFLRASSSSPHIYGDIKIKKKSSKFV